MTEVERLRDSFNGLLIYTRETEAKLEATQQQVERLQQGCDGLNTLIDSMHADLREKEAEVARLQQDNERLKSAFDDEDEKASVYWYMQWWGMKRDLALLQQANAGMARVGTYLLPNDVTVERASQKDGPDRWAVRRHGDCMSIAGVWGYEPSPSNRPQAWLAAHRFDTADAAIAAAPEAPNA